MRVNRIYPASSSSPESLDITGFTGNLQSMVKRKQKRVLGVGYYHPESIAKRLKLAERRNRDRRARELRALLLEVQSLPPLRKLTKSWRSVPYREMRLRQMVEMRKAMTLQQIGDHFGLTRERVRQVLLRQKYGT